MKSLRWIFRHWGGFVSVSSACLLAAPALAEPVQVDVPVQGTTPTTGFTATLMATGSVTISGSGEVNRGNGPFGIDLGGQGFSISPQSVPISLVGGQVSVGTNAAGTVKMTYDNSANGLAPISVDAANISMLNGSSIPIAFNPAVVNASTSVLGINVPITVTVNASGALTALNFHSTGGIATDAPGDNPGLYAIPGLFDLLGNLTANGSGSILGIGFGLGEILNDTINETDQDLFDGTGLPGLAGLTAVTTPDPTLDDLHAQYSLPDLGIAIPIDVSESGNVSASPGRGSTGTLRNYSINYTVSLSLTLTNLSYDISGNVANGVVAVPEPGTLAMASVGLVGLTMFGYRRRRAA